MSKKYKAIYRDVGQVVIGEVESENKTTITLKRPAILHAQAQGEAMNLQFIPMELLSMNPPLSIRSLLKKEAADRESLSLTFCKSQLLHSDVELNDEIFEGYNQATNPSAIITPQNSGGLVDAAGAAISSEPPKVQDLF